jgi:hypothetical protein
MQGLASVLIELLGEARGNVAIDSLYNWSAVNNASFTHIEV